MIKQSQTPEHVYRYSPVDSNSAVSLDIRNILSLVETRSVTGNCILLDSITLKYRMPKLRLSTPFSKKYYHTNDVTVRII
jgi:hypothetical protein